MVSFGEAALRHRKTRECAGPDTVCACLEHAVPARGSSRAASAGERQTGLSGSTGCAPQPISPGGAGGSSTKRPPQLLRGSLLGCTRCDMEQGHCWPCGTSALSAALLSAAPCSCRVLPRGGAGAWCSAVGGDCAAAGLLGTAREPDRAASGVFPHRDVPKATLTAVLCSGTRGCGCQLELLGSVSPAPQAAGRAAARGAALATFLAPSLPAPDLGALQVGERPRADVSQGMLPLLGPGCVSPCPGTARVTATLRPLCLSAKSHPVPFCEIARFLRMGAEGIILPATTKNRVRIQEFV